MRTLKSVALSSNDVTAARVDCVNETAMNNAMPTKVTLTSVLIRSFIYCFLFRNSIANQRGTGWQFVL